MIDKVRVKGSYVYFQTFYTQTGDGTHLEFLAAHIVYILHYNDIPVIATEFHGSGHDASI